MSRRLFCVFFGVVISALGLAGCGGGNNQGGGDGNTFTDPRDNQTYRTVRVGNLTWMAQNLNFQTSNSWCYDNDESNCQKYGRLYDWNTALTACPAGWRLPTNDDWDNLVQAAGGDDVAGTKLKSASPAWNGTDDFGFSALPGGHGWSGDFLNAGNFGRWWSATEHDAGGVWGRNMHWDYSFVDAYWYHKTTLFSLRCLRDNAAPR
ncbi:MAG: fibrobacter succinogenes major paralogous domain-containing protein [Chitinispirillales bacterium]|nr:fibrobacter succinogenes major paralogous domain-containing protein [Chitinispirillales bacterium]